MARKLKISLASSLSNQPALASILLDGKALMSKVSISATSDSYSTYEFNIASGNHTLAIQMDNDAMQSSITDLNLIVGPIQLSKLDGTYHANLYLIPNPAANLHVNDSPEILVTRTLFSAGDELEFTFDSENPKFFRNFNEPTPDDPDFVILTGQDDSHWTDGQIAIHDELKYQYSAAENLWILLT